MHSTRRQLPPYTVRVELALLLSGLSFGVSPPPASHYSGERGEHDR